MNSATAKADFPFNTGIFLQVKNAKATVMQESKTEKIRIL